MSTDQKRDITTDMIRTDTDTAGTPTTTTIRTIATQLTTNTVTTISGRESTITREGTAEMTRRGGRSLGGIITKIPITTGREGKSPVDIMTMRETTARTGQGDIAVKPIRPKLMRRGTATTGDQEKTRDGPAVT